MGLMLGSVAEHAPTSSTEPKAEAIKIVRADGAQSASRARFAGAGMTNHRPDFCNRIHRTWAPLLGSSRTLNSRMTSERVGPYGSMST